MPSYLTWHWQVRKNYNGQNEFLKAHVPRKPLWLPTFWRGNCTETKGTGMCYSPAALVTVIKASCLRPQLLIVYCLCEAGWDVEIPLYCTRWCRTIGNGVTHKYCFTNHWFVLFSYFTRGPFLINKCPHYSHKWHDWK